MKRIFFLTLFVLIHLQFLHTDEKQVQLVESIPLEIDFSLVPGVEDTQKVWIDMIRKAKKSIDTEQFYLINDEASTFEPVIKEIERAAQRGVKIRILADNGLKNYDPILHKRLQALPGMSIRYIDFAELGGIQHAKYWIIDDETVFIGSQNFDWRSLDHIVELGLLIHDQATAKELKQIFDYDWAIAAENRFNISDSSNKIGATQASRSINSSLEIVGSPAALLPSNISFSEDVLLTLIRSAKKNIRIEIEKFAVVEVYTKDKKPIFSSLIEDALREAALIRSVQIEMIVSDWNIRNETNLATLKSLAQIPGITLKVAFIPKYSKAFIPMARVAHSKFMTVDGEILWLGSSNFSVGYFLNSRNVEVIVRDLGIVREANVVFQQLWDSKYTKNVFQIEHSLAPPLDRAFEVNPSKVVEEVEMR